MIEDDASKLNVMWTEPPDSNGIIRNYTVSYQRKGDGGIRINKTVSGSETSTILNNLTPHTTYTIWVRKRLFPKLLLGEKATFVQVQAYTIEAGPFSDSVEATTDQGCAFLFLQLVFN